jgi:hypothetical protein
VQRSTKGKSNVEFVPKLKSTLAVSSDNLTRARLRILHECYRLLGNDLKAANERSVSVIIHDKVRHLQVFIECYILDGPEAQSAACVRSSCPMCMCPAHMFSMDKEQRDDYSCRRRTNNGMKEIYSECDRLFHNRQHTQDGTMGIISDITDTANVHYQSNALTWEMENLLATDSGYEQIATDRMHLCKGLIENEVTVLCVQGRLS